MLCLNCGAFEFLLRAVFCLNIHFMCISESVCSCFYLHQQVILQFGVIVLLCLSEKHDRYVLLDFFNIDCICFVPFIAFNKLNFLHV